MHLALNDDETNIEESTIKIFKKRIKVNQKQFIDFFCPNKITATRVNSIFSKEPETIEWIKSFENNSIFWDIGANIGIYSLYASQIKGINVCSFEPSSFNYFLLNKNIYLNKKDKSINAFNIAFSNKVKIDTLYMSSIDVGGAANSFSIESDSFGEKLDHM